jgi:hypothetical protein
VDFLNLFKGRRRNQVRFEITVLTATGYPDISRTKPAARFGEGAHLIENVDPHRWKKARKIASAA